LLPGEPDQGLCIALGGGGGTHGAGAALLPGMLLHGCPVRPDALLEGACMAPPANVGASRPGC
jgi:hypothetical protein